MGERSRWTDQVEEANYSRALSALGVDVEQHRCPECDALRAIAPRYLWRMMRPLLSPPSAPRWALVAYCEECATFEALDAPTSESEAGQERPARPSRRDAKRS